MPRERLRTALAARLREACREYDYVARMGGDEFVIVVPGFQPDALNRKTGIDINRRRISQQALRELGTFMIPVRLGTEISPTLKVVVLREDEVSSYIAQQKAAAEAPAAAPETPVEEPTAEAAAE